MSTNSALEWVQIGGAPRSGTSALSRMLNTHPEVGVLFEYGLPRLVDSLDQLFLHEPITNRFMPKLAPDAPLPERVTDIICDPDEGEIVRVVTSDQTASTDIHALSDLYIDRSRKIRAMGHEPGAISGPVAETQWDRLAWFLFNQIFPKSDLRIIGDKMPNFLEEEKFLALMQRLPRLKIIVIVRNPIDVVNSSIERRNRSSLGLDNWYIHTVGEACSEWIRCNQRFFDLHDQFPDRVLLLKYEDSANCPAKFETALQHFLGLHSPLDNTVIPLQVPEHLRGMAMTPDERKIVDQQFGDLLDIWVQADWPEIAERVRALAPLYPLGTKLDFSRDESVGLYLVSGFSGAEPNGRWTDGERACLRFMTEPVDRDLRLEIVYTAFPLRTEGQRVARILVNGTEAGLLRAPQAFGRVWIDINIPRALVAGSHTVTLEFELLAPKGAEEEPVQDQRRLGIFVNSLCLTVASCCP